VNGNRDADGGGCGYGDGYGYGDLATARKCREVIIFYGLLKTTNKVIQ